MIINTARPAEEISTGDPNIDGRLRRLVKRRQELIAEGQEIERELRMIDRELIERRFDEEHARAWPNQ